MRKLTAYLLVPIMKLTGLRFSKDYRHAESGWRRWVYAHVDVVLADITAGLPAYTYNPTTNSLEKAGR